MIENMKGARSVAILIDENTRVLVHNATSPYAEGMIAGMIDVGTRVVAGVAVGKRGQVHEGIPLFDTVAQGVAATAANTSVLYVPPAGVADAIVENVDAGIKLMVVVAEYVPVHDAVRALAYARERDVWVIGPNCIGMYAPGIGLLSAVPKEYAMPGPVGLISRSGTMCLAVARVLTMNGLGQSAIINIGGDGVIGRNPVEYARLFEADPATRVIVVVCELGGTREYGLIDAMPELTKPVVVLVLGRYAPAERRMGHAGALANSEQETAQAKREAFRAAGAHVADSTYEVAELVRGLLAREQAAIVAD